MLCRMYDTGTVVCFGHKYSATWALAGTPAAQPYDAAAALAAAWRAGGPPPGGGRAKATPTAWLIHRSIPQKFSARRGTEKNFSASV